MGVNKFATLKNAETGEVVAEMIAPPNALSNDDSLSTGLYALSELVTRGLQPDNRGGGLGGEFGYGANFENAVFMMHRFCWCEQEECLWCSGKEPNFRHKASGLEIEWYKWIGRDMIVSNEKLTEGEWALILKECYESIPLEAREKAEAESKADAEREADPEYQRQQQAAFDAMFQAMSDIHDQCQREGHDDATGHCKRCGLITDFEHGFASIRERHIT